MLRTSVYSNRPGAGLGETVTALALADRWRRWAGQLAATLRLWRQRARSRRALVGLTDRELADIGICRYDARIESNKSFWRD
ncbi:MAG: DUF1127 domain-containing protein [Rhodospirillales bacterium]|nr:DUF1127 domain-containing protein [Rhodospirillales bacterium]MBI2584551.1 DUF1127 domain-containing protein [Rhodospirillales bacterium]